MIQNVNELLKDDTKETAEAFEALIAIIFDFNHEVKIGDFTFETMSDEGIEKVKNLEKQFLSIKNKNNILLPLLSE